MTQHTLIPFTKLHGAGNDFVLMDRNRTGCAVTSALARRLLDRHFGVGGDQLLWLGRPAGGVVPLRFFNADGSEAEMCGNGTRAAAFYLHARGRAGRHLVFGTPGRRVGVSFGRDAISVDMGEPVLEGRQIPVRAAGEIQGRTLRVGGRSLRIHAVSMGNPHCVVFVPRVANFPVGDIGPLIERHSFFPRRVNVEFVEVRAPGRVAVRVWERGAGETLACGSGACAVAVAGVRDGRIRRVLSVDLPGGRLHVRWDAHSNHVFLSGPAEETFSGAFAVRGFARVGGRRVRTGSGMF